MRKNNFAKIISLTLAVITLLSSVIIPNPWIIEGSSSVSIWDGTTVAPTEGDGSENNPYLIKNGSELAFAVNETSRNYFKLVNDIYLNDVSDSKWYESNNLNIWNGGEFIGTLNGNGHVVYGLYINTDLPNNTGSNYGLISKLSLDSTVKNIGLENSYIETNGNVGGIVGNRSWIMGKDATISNCYVGENVILKGSTVGGIIGVNTGGNLIISNCYSLAQVVGTDYAGGITGDLYGNSIGLSNCYTNMAIAVKDVSNQIRTNCYEVTDTFKQENMQGKDVFTNSSKMSQLNSSAAYVPTDRYPILRVFSNAKRQTISISDIAGKYKTQGRTSIVNNALMFDYSASGIEFNAECAGDIEATIVADVKNVDSNGGLYFTVIVDDKVMYENLRIPADNNADNWQSNSTGYPFHIKESGEHTFVIAEGLEAGVHNFKIYSQTETYYGTLGIKEIKMDGTVVEAPADKELYIEIVGDSIAAGLGNLSVGGYEAPLYQDAIRCWPYLTAKEIDADWSLIARSGITATNGIGWNGSGSVSMQTVYPLQRYYSDQREEYDFAKQPDVIIVSLGTNDIWTYVYNSEKTIDDVKNGFKEMLTLLREKNPSAKIVWLYGMVVQSANDVILSAISEMGGEDKDFYSLELVQNTAGGQGHPNLAIQSVYANTIASYIKEILGGSSVDGIWNGYKTVPEQGSGIQGDPYLITNGSELAWAVDNSENKYFKLTSDIYLNDVSKDDWYNDAKVNAWKGGTFLGHLDGDGHIVYGMYIKEQAVGNYGLIPKLDLDSTVKNLGLENSYVDAAGNVGGIVGIRNWNIGGKDAVISNCFVGEKVILKGDTVGGIIACNTLGDLEIANCYSLAEVSGKDFAGGITGDQYGVKVIVSNCYANTVLAEKDVNSQIRTNCYEVTDTFKKENMQGKDVFTNFDKMPYLNICGQYLATEKYPILAIFSNDPNVNVGAPEIAYGYESGLGTKEDPYIIKTVAQLRYLISDNNTKGKYYRLANDIYVNDVSNSNWTNGSPKPWYTNTNGMTIFSGNFDGRGYSIHGLYVNRKSASEDTLGTDGTGLFPFIDTSAVIKNVHIRNSYIAGVSYSGAIAGFIYGNNDMTAYASIIGCSADKTVTVKGYSAGGLLGGGTRGIEIYYSYFTGKLEATGEGRANALVGDIWNRDQRAAQCYTLDYPNYRTNFEPFKYGDIYSNIKQPEAKKVDAKEMIGSKAKSSMPFLDWEYWNVVDGGTPHPKVIEKDEIIYFYDEGVKGRVWSGKTATKYAGGTGTKKDPYLIETPEQLALLVESGFDYNSEIAGKYYKLTADILLNDTSKDNWESNAKNWFAGEYYFDGHLDGNGHIISGLYYKGTAKKAALFPYINVSSSIEKLGIVESKIICTTSEKDTYASAFAAAVVKHWTIKEDKNDIPVIKQCFADSTVYLEAYYAGGITGFGPKPVRLENCFFTGELKYVGHGGGLLGDSWVEGNEVINCYCATANRDTAIANAAGRLSKVENLYVDGPLNNSLDAEKLSLKAMFGDTALKWMEGFDFKNIWKTVENGTPVLRIFGSDKYTCKREPVKVSIQFLSQGGSKCETIYGYPRFTEIPELPTPTRYGYTFGGWYFYEECDVPFNLETYPDYNIWLYPKWIESGFTIDFEENDDINSKYDINGSVQHYRPGVSGYDMKYVHGGMKSLHCLGNTEFNPVFLLSYKNKLTVGNVYDMCFWMTTDTKNASGKIKLIHTKYPDVNDEIYAFEDGLEFTGLTVGEWKQYKITFTAGTPYVLIETPSDVSLFFDDIQIIDTGKKGEFKATMLSNNGIDNIINWYLIIIIGISVLIIVVGVIILLVIRKRKK